MSSSLGHSIVTGFSKRFSLSSCVLVTASWKQRVTQDPGDKQTIIINRLGGLVIDSAPTQMNQVHRIDFGIQTNCNRFLSFNARWFFIFVLFSPTVFG